MLPLPTPSTRNLPCSTSSPVSNIGAKTEPSGSASTMVTSGLTFFSPRPTPERVPPVEPPATKCVIVFSVCSSSSGASVSS